MKLQCQSMQLNLGLCFIWATFLWITNFQQRPYSYHDYGKLNYGFDGEL